MRLRLWLGGAGIVGTRSALLRRLIAGVLSCVVLGGVFGGASSAAAHEIPLSLNETVRLADAVVLGTITAKQSRWGNISKRWMVTEYTLAVENVIYASEKGEHIGTSVMLAYWGGTIGSETQAIADVRLPVVGERLLVFLRPNWAREFGFTPVVGFNQGLLSVSADVTGGMPLVREDSGRPLSLTASGDVVRRPDGVADTATVSLETFIAWLHAKIGLIKAARSQGSLVVDRNDPRVLRTFAKTPSLLSSSDSPTTNAGRSPAETLSADLTAGAPADPSTYLISGAGTGGILDGTQILPQYVTTGKVANLPIVVNNFPDSFAPWSPEDEYQMSKWNYYASDVFRVYTTPTGHYGWPDGVFDLAGWPSSADLQSVYGSPWGSNVIGTTFLRYSGNTIVEADIALNPAFSFTLDDEWVFNGAGSVQGFRQVMIHELGHMHGLDHNFNFLAVMNYFPSVYRFFGLPYMDDAAGIRAEYPSRAVNRTDLGVYLYYGSGFQSVSDATYPSSVLAGGNLTFSNYHVENAGTNTISAPTIEWYLTAARNFNSAYYYLGQRIFSSLAPFTYFTPSAVQTTFTVPTNVPGGTYYLAGFIRDDSGASQSGFPFSNNYAFSRTRIQVVPQTVNYTITVSASPSAGGTVSGGGTFPAGSSRTVTATANSGYTFANWTENGSVVSSSASYTFTLNANRNLVANFTTVNYTITVSASPSAGGTVSGGGTFPAGSSRTVTATPNGGYTFVNWTENGSVVSSSASYTFTLNANRNLVANFTTVNYTITVSASPSAGGTVSGGGTFPAGSSRTVTATANSGYTFTNWTENGSVVSSSASYTFTLNANRNLVANFTTVNYTITVSASPSAGGTVSGGGTFPAGSSRTVTATANSGYTFVNWTENGSVVSSSASYTFTLNANRTLVANFTTNPVTRMLTVGSANPSSGVNITVSPTDNTGQGSGVTQFTRIYNNNTNMALTAASTAGGNNFQKWQLDGVDLTTGLLANFVMDANHTMTAVYATGQGTCASPYFLTVGQPFNGNTSGGQSNFGSYNCVGWSESGPERVHAITVASPTTLIASLSNLGGNDLDVFILSSCSSGSCLAGGDNEASANVGPGTYYIVVDGYQGAVGSYTLTVGRTPFDFDGDGKSDQSVWRPSTGVWLINNSSNGSTTSVSWGVNGDKIVPGDYDGDGKTDIAFWRPSTGVWFIINSSDGSTRTVAWGLTGDMPVPGDYDGDGKADIAIWRPSNGVWFIINSSNGSVTAVGWGVNGDVPVAGDYDGDGKTDIAVWRPSTGAWFIIKSSNNSIMVQGWGVPGDKAVPGDYDGDGKTDIAVWRSSTGVWFIINSIDGSIRVQGWGVNADVPVPGDYDGDGRTDIAVWRPSSGTWFIVNSSNGSISTPVWGVNGDTPVPSAFVGP